ncbi:MAG: hypothetical protein KKB03_04790 [Nanoarchaeota archaeon]|nr:hypothetical protein [Nanoarchaeota archaeon]MBU1135175.1 hypothetical protein [Nanoarchaeota archaeon]MBU2520528.1 hypothetical protein [Nanoarchaeota archaeon]
MDWQILIIGLRKELNLSHEKLANKIGVGRKTTELGEILNINSRSVRKWREGRRLPSHRFVTKLFKLAKENGLDTNDYEVRNNGKTSD